MRTVVISLGGSLVSPKAERVDVEFLRRFCAVILKYVRQGQRFAIIVGGGKIARVWQESLKHILPHRLRGSERGLRDELDWIGIRATQLNAELVRAMFGRTAHSTVVHNPAQKVGAFKVLIGAGFVPGHSTDYDAVVRAKTLSANTVINLSNVDYVYDQDPTRYRGAKPLKELSWADYNKMFHTQWVPGANVPFDPAASYLAARAKISVAFLSGRNLKNVENFLQRKSFRGTVIG